MKENCEKRKKERKKERKRRATKWKKEETCGI